MYTLLTYTATVDWKFSSFHLRFVIFQSSHYLCSIFLTRYFLKKKNYHATSQGYFEDKTKMLSRIRLWNLALHELGVTLMSFHDFFRRTGCLGQCSKQLQLQDCLYHSQTWAPNLLQCLWLCGLINFHFLPFLLIPWSLKLWNFFNGSSNNSSFLCL